jgi:AAA15 family ATPase/GTPase
MPDLLLDSLEISNFRAFDHLKIEKLGRVNLIVGENSVGKTALLEAIRIYVERGTSDIIETILNERREFSFSFLKASARNGKTNPTTSQLANSAKNLFYGRPELKKGLAPIKIGLANSPHKSVSIEPTTYAINRDKSGLERLVEIEGDTTRLAAKSGLGLAIQFEDTRILLRPNAVIGFPADGGVEAYDDSFSHQYISSHGLAISRMKQLWDAINLSNLEDDVNEALRIISDQIERVGFVETQQQPVPIIKLRDKDSPLSLYSLGDGLDRIFGIVLSLVNAQDSILLIDEIESGLHHSVQLELWKVIFKLAHRLNVQVFATTHSWDCIVAFQEAAEQDENEEAMLIRLDRKDGRIVVTLYDERLLEMATRIGMDIRG